MCAVLCTTDLTLDISMEMHKENRQRVLEYLRANNDLPAKTMVVVQGGEAPTFHDTGMQTLATCVQLPHDGSCHACTAVHMPVYAVLGGVQTTSHCSSRRATSNTCLVSRSPISTARSMWTLAGTPSTALVHPHTMCALVLTAVPLYRSMLFCPRLPEEYATWMGRILAPEEFKAMYEVCPRCGGVAVAAPAPAHECVPDRRSTRLPCTLPAQVDEVHYVDQMHDVLTTKTPSRLLTLYGINTDSGIVAKPGTWRVSTTPCGTTR